MALTGHFFSPKWEPSQQAGHALYSFQTTAVACVCPDKTSKTLQSLMIAVGIGLSLQEASRQAFDNVAFDNVAFDNDSMLILIFDIKS